LLDKSSISMPTGHFGLGLLEGERARVRKIAATLGMRHIYAPYLMPDERPKTAAGYRKLGKRLAAIGEWVRGEGYGFGWHNHDFEFTRLPIRRRRRTKSSSRAAPMLDWECDVAWIAPGESQSIRVGQALRGPHHLRACEGHCAQG
jgi:hypothetical protein